MMAKKVFINRTVLKIREIIRPISGEYIGTRLQAFRQNYDAEDGETRCIPKYLVHESSDFTELTAENVKKFLQELRILGFTQYRWYEGIDDYSLPHGELIQKRK